MGIAVGSSVIMIILLPVMIFSMIGSDGRANWFKGIQLLSVYLLIALFCHFLPDKPELPFTQP